MTNIPINQTLADGLEKIVGEKLSSVEFVMDYVQFRFSGPVLSAFTQPTVTRGHETKTWGEAGYADALCKQIGRRVERTAVNDEHVSIAYENGTLVLISLRDDDYRGPEALKFSLDKDHVWVV